MKKKLIINAAACDISKVSAETLEAYEQITVNAALLLSSPKARELMSGIRFIANTATVKDVIEGAVFSIKNGEYTLQAGEAPNPPVMLIVNGCLTVESGTEEALKGYVDIQVNGRAIYPQSLTSALARMKVNGSVQTYPDGAMLLTEDTEIDELFVLRATNRLYYCFGTLKLIDPSLNVAALEQKGARLHAEKAIIAERILPQALPLLNEDAQVLVVKEGYAYLQGSRQLDEQLVFEHGAHLLVDGDLEIPLSSREVLESLKGLQVTGQILLNESMREQLKDLNSSYQSLFLYRGHLIKGADDVQIDDTLLSLHPDGITCFDCTNISLTEELSAQQIREKLRFVDCINIFCTPEQKIAVNNVAKDVINIQTHPENDGKTDQENDSETDEEELDPNTDIINTAIYVL